jgi:hypothetical protein
LTFFSAVSLLLCLASSAAWLRARYYGDSINRVWRGVAFERSKERALPTELWSNEPPSSGADAPSETPTQEPPEPTPQSDSLGAPVSWGHEGGEPGQPSEPLNVWHKLGFRRVPDAIRVIETNHGAVPTESWDVPKWSALLASACPLLMLILGRLYVLRRQRGPTDPQACHFT